MVHGDLQTGGLAEFWTPECKTGQENDTTARMNAGIGRRIFLVLLGMVAGCASHQDCPPDFVVHADRMIGPEMLGVGVQLHPFVYCKPDWGEDVTAENVQIYEKQ